MVGFIVLLLVLPASAYWLFIFFFGHKAWPFAGREPKLTSEESAFAVLEEGSRLESRGRVRDAMEKYHQVMEQFPGTSASSDAQKCLEALRAKTG